MKLFIIAKTNTKEAKIEKIDETHFVVSVKEPPTQGKANRAIITALAEYFHIPKTRISIVAGQTFYRKTIEIK